MNYKESYAHYYSKHIMKSWFVQKYNQHKPISNYFIFDWIAEFRDPDKGIRLEYPIISREVKGKKDYFGLDPVWSGKYPDLDKVKDNGRTIEAVIDLVVISENKLKYGIEVVHKHPTPVSKILILKEIKLPVYEISAKWIMSQLINRIPPKLEIVKIS
jgi:hypothetical protein